MGKGKKPLTFLAPRGYFARGCIAIRYTGSSEERPYCEYPITAERSIIPVFQPSLRGLGFTARRPIVSGVSEDMAENIKGSVLVVGGGIAGMQSALDLADSGYYVYLLEKSPAIGGVMAQLDKTFPTNDCAM
jgi:hypothetical protein